jgi:transcriptional regulator GlxA family with amidase domain
MSVADVANDLQVSRRKLEVRFRSSMHCSVHDFLIRVRIEAAKQLLKFSDEPVEGVAALTGFCHAPHFSNTFKKHIGVSPLQYRNAL